MRKALMVLMALVLVASLPTGALAQGQVLGLGVKQAGAKPYESLLDDGMLELVEGGNPALAVALVVVGRFLARKAVEYGSRALSGAAGGVTYEGSAQLAHTIRSGQSQFNVGDLGRAAAVGAVAGAFGGGYLGGVVAGVVDGFFRP